MPNAAEKIIHTQKKKYMVIKATLGLYLRRSVGLVCPDLIEFGDNE